MIQVLSDGRQRSDLSAFLPEQASETELNEEEHEIILDSTSAILGMEGEMTKASKAVWHLMVVILGKVRDR